MPRFIQSRKEVSHEKILQAASRAIRRSGYAGVGVADIMKEAGLTHGGFYAHFDSRESMLAAAADRAGAESVGTLGQLADAAPQGEGFKTLVKAYLSRAHLERAELGCPVAALGSEMPRQAAEVRKASTRRIKEMIDLVRRHAVAEGSVAAERQALSATATLVGAMIIARAVDDRALGDAVLEASLQRLLDP